MMIEALTLPRRRLWRRGRGSISALALAALLAACQVEVKRVPPPAPRISAVAVGAVTADAAVIWGRCERAADLRVLVNGERGVRTVAEHDFTGRVAVDRLAPATRYAYRAWCRQGSLNARGELDAISGAFRTAPEPTRPQPVRFAWGGDVGGQNVCRDRQRGYPIFTPLAAAGLDFFVALGDMIYADDVCLERGRYGNAQVEGPPAAHDLAGFWAHWRYNLGDAGFQGLLRSTPYVPVWDDHEIRNDSGPHDDADPQARGGRLLPIGRQAFLDYQPLIPPSDDPKRLYRSLRWGKQVEVFLLDTRQYRDAVAAVDSDAQPKTMLGAAQLAWLEQALSRSDATWKILVASVPLSIPTSPAPHDGFASGDTNSGYEREAARLFAMLRAHGGRNTVWITTDVHFATGFLYRPFADDPRWTSHEFTSGPLNAGVFPNPDLDPTFHPERLFLYAPPSPEAITSFDEAIGWFNYGQVDVDADGRLTVAIINGRGERVFERTLEPEPDLR